MVQSVELLLEPALEQRIVGEWDRLISAGLPSQGRHTGASNRPHVTLAVADRLSTQLEDEIAAVAREMMPLRLQLDGLLVFGAGPYVLARAVIATVELLELQQRMNAHTSSGSAIAGGDGRARLFDHQAAGRWTGHVTLARRLDPSGLADALAAVSPVAALSGQATAVRRWDGDRKKDWLIS